MKRPANTGARLSDFPPPIRGAGAGTPVSHDAVVKTLP